MDHTLLMTSECVWALGEDSNFQLVRGPWNWVLRHFQAEGAVWPKLLLKVVSTLKLPIYLYSWFGDCHMQPEIPTLINVYRLLWWWTHCLLDMLLHKAVAASAKIYMLESHWHSEGGDTSEAYLCLNRENRHVQCCADGCWTTHVGKWGGSVWKLILLKTDKVIRFLCTSLQRDPTFYSLVLPINIILAIGVPLLILFWIIHHASCSVYSCNVVIITLFNIIILSSIVWGQGHL